MFNKKRSKGQSTVEYILLVTAVVVIAIFFLVNGSSPFKTQLNQTMGTATNQMNNMAIRWTHAVGPVP